MNVGWSEDLVFEFLDLYKGEPIIWDPENDEHKDRFNVYEAWKRIKNKLSVEVPYGELRRKKSTLMKTYKKLAGKVVKSKVTGAAEVYKPEWFAYQKMASFLPYTPIENENLADSEDNSIELLDDNSSSNNIANHTKRTPPPPPQPNVDDSKAPARSAVPSNPGGPPCMKRRAEDPVQNRTYTSGYPQNILNTGGHPQNMLNTGGHPQNMLNTGGHPQNMLNTGGHVRHMLNPGGHFGNMINPGGHVGNMINPGGHVGMMPNPRGHIGNMLNPGGHVGSMMNPGGPVGSMMNPGGHVGNMLNPGGHGGNVPNTAEYRNYDEIERRMDVAYRYLKQVASKPQAPKDDCDLFVQLLLMKLRALDEDSRELAMHEIDNVMFNLKRSKNASSSNNNNNMMPSSSQQFAASPQQQTYYYQDDFQEVTVEDFTPSPSYESGGTSSMASQPAPPTP